jgi:hypothetical protein
LALVIKTAHVSFAQCYRLLGLVIYELIDDGESGFANLTYT